MNGGGGRALKVTWSNPLFFQKGKLSNREGKDLAPDHRVNHKQSWDESASHMSWSISTGNLISSDVICTLSRSRHYRHRSARVTAAPERKERGGRHSPTAAFHSCVEHYQAPPLGQVLRVLR